MADEYSILGQLNQMNPSGKARDSKEVPVDKDARRRKPKAKKKKAELTSPEDSELEEVEEDKPGGKQSGKVVDIII
jgi:hypothetical protein